MNGNADATLSAVLDAIDWGTAATVTNVVCAAGIALATWGLLRATKRLVHETRRQAALAEAEADAKEQPDVRAWLYPRLETGEPHLELVVANIGWGIAKNVRWWYEDVDKEEWEARHIGGILWPDCRENGVGMDIMRSGDDVRVHLAWGRYLSAPEGTAAGDYEQHSPIKPFSIVIEYENLRGKECAWRMELDPAPLYGMGERAVNALDDIARMLRYWTQRMTEDEASYSDGTHPYQFKPASSRQANETREGRESTNG